MSWNEIADHFQNRIPNKSRPGWKSNTGFQEKAQSLPPKSRIKDGYFRSLPF